jgi:hypothetical protein
VQNGLKDLLNQDNHVSAVFASHDLMAADAYEVMTYNESLPVLGNLGAESGDFLGEYVVSDPDFPIPADMAPTWDAH